jgi:phytoene dehydrogenase-like protein
MRIGVVGAGHNCLVAAARLASAGHQVEIFERSDKVGGACTTRRFSCGCYVNEAANALGLLHPEVLKDLDAAGGAPEITLVDPAVALPRDGDPLAIYADPLRTANLVAERTRDSRDAVLAYFEMLEALSRFTRELWADPRATFADFRTAVSPLGEVGRLVAEGSLSDLLRHFFVDEETLALFAAGNLIVTAPPSAPGTAFGLAYLSQGNVRGRPGWGLVRGGIGYVADSLAANARAAGAEIHLRSSVTAIELEAGRVRGLRTSRGGEHLFDVVVSGADPYSTFWSLLGHEPSVAEQRDQVAERAMQGGCAKINFLLDHPPSLERLSAALDVEGLAFLVCCPTLEILEMAARDLNVGQHSRRPYCELSLDYELDTSASCGRHFPASVYLLFAPYARPQGLPSSAAYRESLMQAALRVVREYLPDFATSVAWSEVLLPDDLERRYGMHLGNVDHGPMVPENSLERRGLPQARTATTGVPGLYLCGAGIHPGGLVSGIPGLNAVAALLERPDG